MQWWGRPQWCEGGSARGAKHRAEEKLNAIWIRAHFYIQSWKLSTEKEIAWWPHIQHHFILTYAVNFMHNSYIFRSHRWQRDGLQKVKNIYIYIFMYNSSDSLCIHYNKKANDKFELNFMRIHQYVWFHITTNHVKYTRARHSNLRFMFYINPENKTLRIMIEMLPGS